MNNGEFLRNNEQIEGGELQRNKKLGSASVLLTEVDYETSSPQREKVIEKTSYSFDMGIAKDLLFRMMKSEDQDMYHIARGIVPEETVNPTIPGYDEFGADIFKKDIHNAKNFLTYYLNNRGKLDLTQDKIERMQAKMDDINEIEESGVLEWKKLSEIEASESFWPTVFTQGDYFTHEKGISGMVYGMEVDKIECRLYLCPRVDNVIGFVKAIDNKHLDNTHIRPYYLKFAHSGERNDRIVYYTNFERIPGDLIIFNEIAKEQPELFEGMGKNPFWGNIEGAPEGIYFGEEPNHSKIQNEKYGEEKGSYGSVRARAYELAYQKWINSGEKSEYYENLKSSSEISDEDVERFNDIFAKELLEIGINPNNLCTNI